MTGDREGRWDHNIHYHPVVLDSVPAHAERALDVGCGEGLLTRRLARVVRHVVGIDRDRSSILAAQATSGGEVDYVMGDFLRHPFRPASFDLVVSVASLHHMNGHAALDRMRALLRPGGRLTIVGLARTTPFDLPRDVAGVVADRLHKLTRTEWDGDLAPRVWPPPLTFRQTRRLVLSVLPDATYRRHLLWRYSLVWTKR